MTDTTTTESDPAHLGTESSLSTWVGPYVTDMLGKGAALGAQDYQAYTGPLTTGPSTGQTAAFQGIAGLAAPTAQMGAFTPSTFTADKATQYMNPYLEAALEPQYQEAIRQAEARRLQDARRLTKAGAYGGSRQAIMESEGNRNLLQNLANITGTGYATAYDKAAQQFNTEQGRQQTATDAANVYGLQALQRQMEAGKLQRDIETEGVAADRAQFEEERDFPYKQVQYMQSLLQGLPLAAQSYTYAQPSALSKAMETTGGLQALYDDLFGGD